MPIPLTISPSVLRVMQPLCDALGPIWDTVLAGLATVPDPELAAANFSRLFAGGRGSGAVIGNVALTKDLLFVLGASQHFASVLCQQGDRWEALFLSALNSSLKSAEEHLATLRGQLPKELSEEEFLSGLRAYRNREYFRIGTRDLLRLASLEETTRDLSFLAEAAVQIAYEYTRAKLCVLYGDAVREEGGRRRPLGFVVFGMGKFGGMELNFSSDIDLIYLYEQDGGLTTGGEKGEVEPRAFFSQLAQRLTRALSDLVFGGRVFRVDLRLRPDGVNGPVVNSLPNTLLYYESWGQTWERVALLKARPVAGDKNLGEQFLREVAPFVFRHYLDYATLEDIKEMKTKVERALRAPERGGMNVKLGRGGIREIEFVAQALQLIHAGKDPRVRERTTLPALDRLVECRYLTAADRDVLRDAYRFLRHVEHKLQIVQDRQTHTLPSDEEGVRALARRLCIVEDESTIKQKDQDNHIVSVPSSETFNFPLPTGVEGDEVERFWATLRSHTDAVHQIFRTLFRESEKETDSHGGEISVLFRELQHEEETLQRLQQLGFHQLPEAYANLRLLHDGPPHSPSTPKRRKLLYDLEPLLLQEVAKAADPDRALAAISQLVASIGARSSFLALLKENPTTLSTLIGLFGASEYLTRVFLRHPELLDSLVRADLVQVRKTKKAMLTEIMARLQEVREFEDRLDILRRYRTEEFLRIGINDSNGLLDITEVTEQLTYLADVCVSGAYEVARLALMEQLGYERMPGQFAIVGMGKLGAGELNYNSDLDLIFIYDPEEEAENGGKLSPQEFFTKLVQRLISVLQVQTREGYVYKVDTRLRPSGRSGSLVSSMSAFLRYHETSSQLWERQALIKARVVVADPAFQASVTDLLERMAYAQEIDAEGVAEIDRLRGRIEQELAHEQGGRFNIKIGRGGIVDIEFLVQMLQLRYGRQFPALRQRATLSTLQALRTHNVMPEGDVKLLEQGYRFLRGLENRLRIEHDQPVEAIESSAAQLTPLARRLGYEGEGAATQLLNDYQNQREAIRSCYNRWFAREKGQGT